MNSYGYQLAQNGSLTLNQPANIGAVAGDNPGPYYIHFPDLPPPFNWVFPYTYGFVYPLPTVQTQMIQVNTSDTPPGSPPAPSSTAVVRLTTYDLQLPYNPGRVVFGGSQAQFPNQGSFGANIIGLTDAHAAWALTPVAGKSLNIFFITPSYITTAGTALYYIGTGFILPTNFAIDVLTSALIKSGNTGSFQYSFGGAPASLGSAAGIWVWNASGANLDIFMMVTYSLTPIP